MKSALDYHRLPGGKPGGTAGDDARYKQRQAQIFQQQLEVAIEAGLNCVIHQRDSFDDTFAQLKPFAGKVRGVFHCFGESADRMRRVLEIGSLVSFTGIVTFKNGQNVRDTVAATPLGPIHAGNRLSVSRARAVSRQTLRTGLCEGNFRNRRPGEGLFARRIERGDVQNGGGIFPEVKIGTPNHRDIVSACNQWHLNYRLYQFPV